MTSKISIVLVLVATAALAEPADLGLSLDEFKMYRHYLNAMSDPRVQKMKPEQQLPAIAKDAGFKLKDLKTAVEKGEAAGDIKAKCEANIQEALGKTEIGGRVAKVEVDVSEPHAVAYVNWHNENTTLLEEEAAYLAAATQPACPLLSTIQVWANDKANPGARVFQALISGGAALKIKPEKVKDFADTRYIRLFEKVKSVAAGDDLSQASGTPGGK